MGNNEPGIAENFINGHINNNGCDKEEDKAKKYLKHLLNDGCNEFDDDNELSFPSWYDEQLFSRGQSYGNKYRLVLFGNMLTGLIAVLAIPSILTVLICTKQSSNAKMAYRRYVKTILHVSTWHEYPLKPGSKSWRSIEEVRKNHSKSSKHCEKSNSIRITQKDLALTQFGFMGFICLQASKMGIDDPEFHRATIHLWRVIGHLLGIKDEYNLCTDSWLETKARLEIVMNELYKPALENPTLDFISMTKALIDGLWPVMTTLRWDVFMFSTKRLANCKGFEYFKDENFGDETIKFSEYYKLSFYDRFLVSYGLMLSNVLYKFDLFRRYINFRIWLNEKLMYYFPYLAMYKYGIKWAYVRILTSDDDENRYHQD